VTTVPPADPLDDDALGALVRSAASEWAMPPVRLEAPSWRERVRTPRARRIAGLRGLAGRVGQAAGAAIVLTISAALLGVWLSTPHNVGKPSPVPGSHVPASQAPRSTDVAASPLPKLFVQGEPPSPSRILVSLGSYFSVLDLGAGTLGNPINLGAYGSDLRRNADGVAFCLCLTGDEYANSIATRLTVAYQQYSDGGAPLGPSHPIGVYKGTPDPRDGTVPEQPQQVTVHITYADATHAYVGWSLHDHPAWRSGFAIVDTSTGQVVSRVDLPDRGDGTGNTRVFLDAPRVLGLTSDGRLVIDRSWYSWSPPASQNPTMSLSYDAFTATLSGPTLTGVAPFPAAQGCGEDLVMAGPRPDVGGTWLTCRSAVAGQTIVRLVGTDSAVDDLHVDASLDAFGETGGISAVSPDGRSFYAWDPSGLTLTRVDLVHGQLTSGHATTAAVPNDPLLAIGRWLAPPAAAKILLSSGIAISPDGSRVYALGIELGSLSGADFAGSSGILVFDAATLANVGHWSPTADFVSIAVSADGQSVYAAGSPQYSAGGVTTSQPASVTVFDASTGSIRLIAGSLGRGFLTFPATILP